MIDITSIGIGVSSAEVKNAARDLDKLGTSADKASRKTDQLGAANARAEKQTAGLAVAVKALGVAYAAIAGVSALSRQIDEYTKFTAQLKLATRSQEQYNKAIADVRRIADTAQASLSSIGILYARLNNSLRDLGVSQERVAKVSETVGLALKVSGATANESTSAMLQLSQAFGSGVLRGEEFNAVNEAAPALMRALAESIGVPVGALREMASEGQLTSDVLLKAFSDDRLLASYREQAKEVETISGAVQELKNQWTELAGSIKPIALPLILKVVEGTTNAIKWFEHFVFDKGELADLERKQRYPEALSKMERELGLLQSGGNNLDPGNTAEFRARRIREVRLEINRLRAGLGLPEITGNDIAGSRAITGGAPVGPSFTAPVYAQDIDKLHREQERAAAAQKKAAEDIAAINKKARDQAIADLQYQIDFETDMAEVRTKREYDETQKRKQAEIDAAKARADAIAAINQKASDDYLRMVKQQAEKAMREYERMAESLTQSITDALFRGFENGKSFFENFKDTLINAFKTLILRPQIEFLVKSSGIAGLFSSGGAFGETAGIPNGIGGGGILSTGKTLFDGITKGFNSLNFGLQSSIEQLGANIANGMGGIRDAIGGFMGTNSSMIASSLAYIPAAFSLLKGDFKSAAFQGAGAAIGTAFGGPIGGAIGSFIGGAVGGLFGKESPKLYGASGSARYNSTGLTGSSSNFGRSLGGGALKSIEGLAAGFAGTLGGYLEGFGINSNVGASAVFRKRTNTRGHFAGNVDGQQVYLSQSYGKDGDMQESFQDFVNKVMGPLLSEAIRKSKLPAGIRSLFSGITNSTQITNMMNATLGLQAAQSQLADRFGLTVDQAGRVAKATGLAGDALIEFVNKLAGSALAFKSQSEILLEVREQLTKDIGSLPTSLDQFDALLKAIDTTTSAGIAEFQKLFALRDQFAQFTGAIDMLKAGVTGAVFSLMSPSQQLAQMQADLQTLFGNLGLSVPNSIQELMALSSSIDYTTETGLDLAAAFPSLVQAFLNTKNGVESLTNSLDALDSSRFKTLVDYTRAQRYSQNGIPLSMLPSYDVGTDFVPNDGPAMIHRGERILTRDDNAELMRRLRDPENNQQALIEEIRRLREEVRAGNVAIAIPAQKTAKSIDRMERNGVLIRDVDNDGEPVVFSVNVMNDTDNPVPIVDTTV